MYSRNYDIRRLRECMFFLQEEKMKSFIAVDLETTGLSPEKDHIIEIGALKYVEGKMVEKFSRLVKPPVYISSRITDITGIDNKMVEEEDDISIVMEEFLKFVGDEKVLLGHNLKFDYSFLKVAAKKLKFSFEKDGLDTMLLARKLVPELPKKNLASVSEYFGVQNPRAHRAYEDAQTTALVYLKMLEQYEETTPEAFVPKQMQFKVKKEEPITIPQKNYLNDLIKYHKIQVEMLFDGKATNIDELTKSQASKMIDGIIFQYGKIRRG